MQLSLRQSINFRLYFLIKPDGHFGFVPVIFFICFPLAQLMVFTFEAGALRETDILGELKWKPFALNLK